jgi:hypothetical protein
VGLSKGDKMVVSMVAMFLMWQTFRFKFKTRGAVLSILFVIMASFWSKNIIGVATLTALVAGATTMELNYAKMVARLMIKFTRRLNETLSNGFSKMKR